MHRRSVGSGLLLLHEGILLHRRHRDRQLSVGCYRRLLLPFALLLSRIRNKIMVCKSTKNHINQGFSIHRPRKNFGYKAHRRKQGEGVVFLRRAAFEEQRSNRKNFRRSVRNSSEFRWVHFACPEYAFRP